MQKKRLAEYNCRLSSLESCSMGLDWGTGASCFSLFRHGAGDFSVATSILC